MLIRILEIYGEIPPLSWMKGGETTKLEKRDLYKRQGTKRPCNYHRVTRIANMLNQRSRIH